MLQLSGSRYICWSCISSSFSRGSSRNVAGGRATRRPRAIDHSSLLSMSHIRAHATIQDTHDTRDTRLGSDRSLVRPPRSIRERLRAWEAENPSPAQLLIPTIVDAPAPGAVMNTRMSAGDIVKADEDAQEQAMLQGDGLMDLRSDTSRLEAGDLLELTSESWNSDILAVCLGNFNGLDHFYTHTGKWLTSTSIRTRFIVKRFIRNLEELRPVLDELPPRDTPLETIRRLQDLRVGPSRNAGAELLASMHRFQSEARRTHQTHINRFRSVLKNFGNGERLMTLYQMAEKTLPEAIKNNGQFSPQALYAVHIALRQDELAFKALSTRGDRQSYFFVGNSKHNCELALDVEQRVREFYEDPRRLRGPLRDGDSPASLLERFILKARSAIDSSRKRRDWSNHGILSPMKKLIDPVHPAWTSQELVFVEFIERWATDMFDKMSSLHWVGSAILRAVNRYPDAEYLTNATGWEFLQEIGWLMPWDIHARHQLRLPDISLSRSGGVAAFAEDEFETALGPDVFKQSPTYPGRKPTAARVFCIDSESTVDVDDGISLERADTPGEYWVNIHVADPASRIAPDTWPAKRAALLSQTAYLPGHYGSMFRDPIVRDTFALAPSGPALTFCARVNKEGDLLSYKIEPTTLKDVVYMTPEEVSTVTGDQPLPFAVPAESFAVGKPPSPPSPAKKVITKAGDLSAEDVEDLRVLSRLAKALQDRRNAKGAIPYYMPRPIVQVSLEGTEIIKLPDGFMHCNGDPYIQISSPTSSGSSLVSSLMQLAGEVAAQWCAVRSIPIPYRVQDPGSYQERLDAFTRTTFYPQLLAGRKPPAEQWHQLRALAGPQELSSAPAPLYTMGLDMYTKATSPLRRYGDLLVHWQIEAALLEEARRGKSLVGNTDDGFLPFMRIDLDRKVLPHLKIRERHSRLLDNVDGTAEWMLQALVRAWKFGEPSAGTPLPETFHFTVRDVVGGRRVVGNINWFDRDATLDATGIQDVALMQDIRPGDVFEVELTDVNVFKREITVKALRKARETASL
ncbi:RNB-domain-containing protein [Thozetella sp. PMI_491]|nr:RNB-domain-containing protein [Thozetella sp. PMI_491]